MLIGKPPFDRVEAVCAKEHEVAKIHAKLAKGKHNSIAIGGLGVSRLNLPLRTTLGRLG